MNFWQLYYTRCLTSKNLIQPIYDAMKNDDYSKVIMVVLNILEENNLFLTIEKSMKSEIKSNQLRNEGNEQFKKRNYCKALEFYNRALMYAPQNTESEKFAYSNRSAVLYKNKEYTACVIDIQICFSLGCPLKINEKLEKRMEQALLLSEQEGSVRNHINEYVCGFYQYDVNAGVNSQIPSASTDIEVVMENNERKIIAANDIKVGTLLAFESSFVSCNASPYFSIACHYCHKISLNLIPCDGCCSIMFCNEKCKKICMEEYHKIECEIIEVISTLDKNPKDVLMIKGAIKFVRMCKSWKEVISASYCTGEDRIHSSSVQEMFDVNNKLSVLSYSGGDQQFVHGKMFNTCFVCAIVIHCLEKVPAFMPGLYGEKKLAKEALGRLMMYFKLYATPTLINQTTSNRKNSTIYYNELFNNGWYPLIGKLKDSCTPNVIVSNLNKTAALIALQPIKKGTELTVPHIDHHLNLENISIQKKKYLKFYLFEKVRKCNICNDLQNSKRLLTKEQLDTYRKTLSGFDDKINTLNVHSYLPKICELLTCLNYAPLSNEYKNVYSKFYECLMACEETLTGNCVLDTFQFSPNQARREFV